jgi:hypothetical protein
MAAIVFLLAGCAGRALRSPLGQRFSPELEESFGLEKREKFLARWKEKNDGALTLVSPRHISPTAAVYRIRGSFHGIERGHDLEITLNENGKIIGLYFRPRPPRPALLERNRTSLRLPLAGRVLVSWGGDRERENRNHHAVTMQQKAFDLLAVDEEGKSRRGRDETNADFYCWGKKVLAPAPGIIREVIDGVHDNVPGRMNSFVVTGNAVILQHAEGEVSFFGHLQHGSIKVQVGERVAAGDTLGLCGNSGNSSEPHLHYHVQDVPQFEDGIGIKVFFSHLRRLTPLPEKRFEEYSPVRGDIIESLNR